MMLTSLVMQILGHQVLDKQKIYLYDGASWKITGSLKLFRCIFLGPWMYVQIIMPINSMAVEILGQQANQ